MQDNIKERSELADICYMTIERECAKPLSDIDTELVTACIELANILLDIHSLTDEELAEATKKLKTMTLRRRKSLKVRVIAAIVAVLLLLGTTVYAFSDWIFNVFGIETLQTIAPGDKVTVDNNVLDAAESKTVFYTVDELYGFIGDSVMLPSKEGNAEFADATYSIYDGYDLILTTWKIGDIQVDYIVEINALTENCEDFNKQKYEHYSQNHQPYDIIDTDNGCQAATVIDKIQYTIFCTDKEILIEFIDTLE